MGIHPKDIVSRFRNYKVLVIGDAILDAYIKGTTDKICREAPAPVVNVREQENNCGGAANTAINLAALGAETYFVTVVGKDVHAEQLFKALQEHGVKTAGIIRDKTRQTIAKIRISAASNILLRVDQGSTDDISDTCIGKLTGTIKELAKKVDAIVISDYGYGVFTPKLIEALMPLRKNQDKLLIVDAKEPQKFKRLSPTAIKPNYEEALAMLALKKVDKSDRAEQMIANAQQLLEVSGAKYVASTLDADGSLLFQKGKKVHKIPCIPHDDKKAIGAGDTFISALALSLCANASAKMAVEIAAAAAAVVIEKEGTETCTDIELKAYFSGNVKFIPSLQDLSLKIKDLKKEHKRIVFTNGCFDILHRGHVNFLNLAKAEGDVLIVGLNSDESICRVKGENRPINSLEDRVAVLAGLKSVDYLIAFEEDTPIEILQMLQPEVFAKGGTYTMDSLPEANLVEQLGGKVTIIPFTTSFSTTKLIEKIRHSSYGIIKNKIRQKVL